MEEFFAAKDTTSEGMEDEFPMFGCGGEIAFLSRVSWVKACHETNI